MAERTGVAPSTNVEQDTLFEDMDDCRIQCHGGGTEHQASICLQCPRFVSCKAGADHRSVIVSCWWQREAAQPERRRLARGSRLIDTATLRCVSCGSDDTVGAHPRMDNVPICRDCLDASLEQIDYAELGIGD